MSVDNRHSPTAVRISLKKSKLSNGVDVYVGKIDSTICPVGAELDYTATRGPNSGPFFRFSNGDPLTKSKFTVYKISLKCLVSIRPSLCRLCWTQF